MVDKLIHMMVLRRVDAIIAYPSEAQYVMREMGGMPRITYIHVAGMDEYSLSYAGCSKTEKGKMLVNRLNATILKNRTTPAFMEFY